MSRSATEQLRNKGERSLIEKQKIVKQRWREYKCQEAVGIGKKTHILGSK